MPAMPKVTGLFETHLTVSDLDRSIEFYRETVGLPLALELHERGAAFFWIGGPGEAHARPVVDRIGADWASRSTSRSRCRSTTSSRPASCPAANGVTPLSFFATETTEPSVIGWMPAAAVYFRDPDGHLIEYLAMLEEPARPERGIVPWSEWNARPRRP